MPLSSNRRERPENVVSFQWNPSFQITHLESHQNKGKHSLKIDNNTSKSALLIVFFFSVQNKKKTKEDYTGGGGFCCDVNKQARGERSEKEKDSLGSS